MWMYAFSVRFFALCQNFILTLQWAKLEPSPLFSFMGGEARRKKMIFDRQHRIQILAMVAFYQKDINTPLSILIVYKFINL